MTIHPPIVGLAKKSSCRTCRRSGWRRDRCRSPRPLLRSSPSIRPLFLFERTIVGGLVKALQQVSHPGRLRSPHQKPCQLRRHWCRRRCRRALLAQSSQMYSRSGAVGSTENLEGARVGGSGLHFGIQLFSSAVVNGQCRNRPAPTQVVGIKLANLGQSDPMLYCQFAVAKVHGVRGS